MFALDSKKIWDISGTYLGHTIIFLPVLANFRAVANLRHILDYFCFSPNPLEAKITLFAFKIKQVARS